MGVSEDKSFVPDVKDINNLDESAKQKLILDSIAKNIATNKEYAKKLFTTYEFAKSEFKKAGVDLDQETHKQMKDGFEMISNAAAKVMGRNTAAAEAVSVSVHVGI